ncbi:Uncharacterised protein [Serratia proteamaculans]|nr:Uncharacterised protein [Serratia proteamaculans]
MRTLCSVLLLQLSLSYPALADVKITGCPESNGIGGRGCIAIGAAPSSYPSIGAGGVETLCMIRFDALNSIFGTVTLVAAVQPPLPGPGCSTAYLDQYVRTHLPSGIPVTISAGSPTAKPSISLWGGRTTATAFVHVSWGVTPTTCTVLDTVTFDHGNIPTGTVQQTAELPLRISCTGKTTGSLSLQDSANDRISIRNSGLSSLITVNGKKLGTTLDLKKGANSFSVGSALTGTTTSTGIRSGSGILVLKIN